MFNILNPWKPLGIAMSVAFVLMTAWALRVDSLRAEARDQYATLHLQADAVVAATQVAAENPTLKWADVPQQIAGMGAAYATLKGTVADQNSTLAGMKTEGDRLRAQGAQLQKEVAVAQAARASALDQLTQMANTPGDRQNCPTMLKQAESALDLVRDSGL